MKQISKWYSWKIISTLNDNANNLYKLFYFKTKVISSYLIIGLFSHKSPCNIWEAHLIDKWGADWVNFTENSGSIAHGH